jgi:3-deoxy-D-manno-octulosonic-acid transferase
VTSLYGALATGLGAGAYPFLRIRARAGDDVWRERLALGSAGGNGRPDGERPLWCHAASVGEVESLLPVLEAARTRGSAVPILLSTMTVTGRDSARRRAGGWRSRLLPLDVPWIVARAFEAENPRAVLVTETELWPAFLREARRRSLPAVLVNGRISQASFARYRWVRPLVREMLNGFRLLLMQGGADAERAVRLGAPPARVRVLGSAKADAGARPLGEGERRELRRAWGLAADAFVWVAGSVRPLEVEAVLDAAHMAREKIPGFRLVVAPRHLEVAGEMQGALRERGFRWRLRRDQVAGMAPDDVEVLLLDTMGELGAAYSLGDVAFVGGTLDARYGGHNPLEPAARGVPVLLGPYRRNCEETVRRLLQAGGAREVSRAEDLADELRRWAASAPERRAAGECALGAARSMGGVAERIVDALEEAGFPWNPKSAAS